MLDGVGYRRDYQTTSALAGPLGADGIDIFGSVSCACTAPFG